MNKKDILVNFIIAGLLVIVPDYFFNREPSGNLIFIVVFWLGVFQGCIALIASTELINAEWIEPVKKQLLSLYPFILFLSVIFLFVIKDMDVYPWTEHQGIWLNKTFFIIRNFILILLSFLFARKFALAVIQKKSNKNFYAVIYLFIFVFSQSLTAFDIVMSLEYPWMSTLFGGYFFIESIFAGMAVAGILICIYHFRKVKLELYKTHYDLSTLIFGFSLLWAGLFYAQFLVIWYGNLPEEIIFISNRLSESQYRGFCYLIPLFIFIIPFLGFLFKKAKESMTVLYIISNIILLGIFIERIVFIFPALHIGLIAFIIQTAVISISFYVFILSGLPETD